MKEILVATSFPIIRYQQRYESIFNTQLNLMNVILQFLKIKEINTHANRLLRINILFLSYKILIRLKLFKMEKNNKFW